MDRGRGKYNHITEKGVRKVREAERFDHIDDVGVRNAKNWGRFDNINEMGVRNPSKGSKFDRIDEVRGRFDHIDDVGVVLMKSGPDPVSEVEENPDIIGVSGLVQTMIRRFSEHPAVHDTSSSFHHTGTNGVDSTDAMSHYSENSKVVVVDPNVSRYNDYTNTGSSLLLCSPNSAVRYAKTCSLSSSNSLSSRSNSLTPSLPCQPGPRMTSPCQPGRRTTSPRRSRLTQSNTSSISSQDDVSRSDATSSNRVDVTKQFVTSSNGAVTSELNMSENRFKAYIPTNSANHSNDKSTQQKGLSSITYHRENTSEVVLLNGNTGTRSDGVKPELRVKPSMGVKPLMGLKPVMGVSGFNGIRGANYNKNTSGTVTHINGINSDVNNTNDGVIGHTNVNGMTWDVSNTNKHVDNTSMKSVNRDSVNSNNWPANASGRNINSVLNSHQIVSSTKENIPEVSSNCLDSSTNIGVSSRLGNEREASSSSNGLDACSYSNGVITINGHNSATRDNSKISSSSNSSVINNSPNCNSSGIGSDISSSLNNSSVSSNFNNTGNILDNSNDSVRSIISDTRNESSDFIKDGYENISNGCDVLNNGDNSINQSVRIQSDTSIRNDIRKVDKINNRFNSSNSFRNEFSNKDKICNNNAFNNTVSNSCSRLATLDNAIPIDNSITSGVSDDRTVPCSGANPPSVIDTGKDIVSTQNESMAGKVLPHSEVYAPRISIPDRTTVLLKDSNHLEIVSGDKTEPTYGAKPIEIATDLLNHINNSHTDHHSTLTSSSAVPIGSDSSLIVSEGHVEGADSSATSYVKDGQYFLGQLREETERLKARCVSGEEYLNDTNITEEARGKVRAAVGKASLLTTKKFQQFETLCRKNISEKGEGDVEFSTRNEDLAGFWDLVHIQIDEVDRLFNELDLLHHNEWADNLIVNTMELNPGVSNDNHNLDTAFHTPTKTQNGPSTPATSRPAKSRGAPTPSRSVKASGGARSKAQEEARKRLMEAKLASKQRKAAGALDDDIQIFIS